MADLRIPEQAIYRYLLAANLLGSWTDFNDSTQPAFVTQLYEFDETVTNNYERILLIRNSGAGGGDWEVKSPIVTLSAFSRVGTVGDGFFARNFMELVKRQIDESSYSEFLHGINTVGDVSGPYITESGRRAYELTLTLLADTGV